MRVDIALQGPRSREILLALGTRIVHVRSCAFNSSVPIVRGHALAALTWWFHVPVTPVRNSRLSCSSILTNRTTCSMRLLKVGEQYGLEAVRPGRA